AHPHDALVIIAAFRLAVFVFPVRGDAFLGNAMHILSTNLNFERLAAMNHGRMQRLIEIRPRHSDVVLEAAGNGAPNMMDDAKRGIATALRVGNDANS